jgi:hypothetical protein
VSSGVSASLAEHDLFALRTIRTARGKGEGEDNWPPQQKGGGGGGERERLTLLGTKLHDGGSQRTKRERESEVF